LMKLNTNINLRQMIKNYDCVFDNSNEEIK
jgi:hypothetical protein